MAALLIERIVLWSVIEDSEIEEMILKLLDNLSDCLVCAPEKNLVLI